MMKSRHNGSGDRGCKSAANVSYYLVDRNIESGEADVTALIIDGVQVTYGELYRRSSNVAAGLEEFGVRREDRVMLVLPDDANFVYCFLAALRIGAIPVPVNPHAAVRDVLDTADRSGVRAAITHRCELATHFETMPRPPIVLGVGWEPSASRSIDELVSVDRERPAEPVWPDSYCVWLCTSGSTGDSKLAIHRHHDIPAVLDSYVREVIDMAVGDRAYSGAPLFHAYGLGCGLYFPLGTGAASVLESRRPTSGEELLAVLRCREPSHVFAVPTTWARLARTNGEPGVLRSVRKAVSAGEALPGEVFERLRERYGLEVLDGIGSTEMMHVYCSNRPGRARPATCGTPVTGYDVKLLDDNGEVVVGAGIGEMWVRGDSAASGYWCQVAETRDAFHGGWFRTRDLFARDGDGYYQHLGRVDDMLKVMGEWVSPAEVEVAITGHPLVKECAVIGGIDDDGLTQIVAVVVPNSEELTVPSLRALAGRELPGYKRPSRFVFTDTLPVTPTGKLRRAVLREAFLIHDALLA